ncbi:MAG: hypothetical protein H0T68_05280 [Gemmatimonadales bacterium]|nr:hypothetical protein [Gemmatimonadales bacterium]
MIVEELLRCSLVDSEGVERPMTPEDILIVSGAEALAIVVGCPDLIDVAVPVGGGDAAGEPAVSPGAVRGRADGGHG